MYLTGDDTTIGIVKEILGVNPKLILERISWHVLQEIRNASFSDRVISISWPSKVTRGFEHHTIRKDRDTPWEILVEEALGFCKEI